MKKKISMLICLISVIFLFSCKKDNSAPVASFSVFPSAGSPDTYFEFDASGSYDDETDISSLLFRVDWENDGKWDLDWSSEKNITHQFIDEGDYVVVMEVKDEAGNVSSLSANLTVTSGNQIVPSVTPFSYNVGINYETWHTGRKNYNIATDLDTITNHFRLIKTFHFESVNPPGSLTVDPTMQSVINYVVQHESKAIELALGTSVAVLSKQENYKWKAGFMTSSAYTDGWVTMLINAFGSADNVKKHVKVILLSNEVDMNGPTPTDTAFKSYITTWMSQSFSNLKNSLASKGLTGIPVTTIIANYPLGDPNSNKAASAAVQHVVQNWSPSWNGGKPFVMFNQYTPNWGKSTDYGPVIKYFGDVFNRIGSQTGIYVGETGFSAEYGDESKVIRQIFDWLGSQYKTNGKTVPLFLFDAFDLPDKGVGQKKMGIFQDNPSSNIPTGVKPGINIPSWVKQKKN